MDALAVKNITQNAIKKRSTKQQASSNERFHIGTQNMWFRVEGASICVFWFFFLFVFGNGHNIYDAEIDHRDSKYHCRLEFFLLLFFFQPIAHSRRAPYKRRKTHVLKHRT